MKVLVVLSALVAFAAAGALTPTELEQLEAFDYSTLLVNDDQTMTHVFNCLLEKEECGPYKQVAELSMKLMMHQCAECSPAQKTKYESILKQLHDKYETSYIELMKKVAAKKE